MLASRRFGALGLALAFALGCGVGLTESAPSGSGPAGGGNTGAPRADAGTSASTDGAAPTGSGDASTAPDAAAPVDTLRAAATSTGRLIGAALLAAHLSEDSTFGDVAGREFSFVTPENEMKWDSTEPSANTFTFGSSDQIVKFAESHDMKVKGHTLVWHQALPAWVSALSTPASAKAALVNHVKNVVGHFKGRLAMWDVVNEAFTDDATPALRNFVFTSQLGESYIEEAFRAAHEADPAALLFYNDYSIEAANAKSQAVADLVTRLKAKGVHIDGVGLQTHVSGQGWPSATDLAAAMKRFVDLDLLVNISEIDVRIGALSGDLPSRLEAQRTRYHDLVAVCVAQPKCLGVTFWGVTDKYSWLNMEEFWSWAGKGPHYPLPFDDRYAKKPAYFGVLDALRGR